jgi:phosphate transport system substrate-binding protein
VLTKIVAYSRESSSGTYEFFKDELWTRKFATNILNLPATGAIVQAVGQTKALLVISDWHMKLK